MRRERMKTIDVWIRCTVESLRWTETGKINLLSLPKNLKNVCELENGSNEYIKNEKHVLVEECGFNVDENELYEMPWIRSNRMLRISTIWFMSFRMKIHFFHPKRDSLSPSSNDNSSILKPFESVNERYGRRQRL